MTDAAQRSVLFWDVLRQRGNQYREHLADTVPHVLDYKVELLVDGRRLGRPVNYALARVIPPAGIEINPKRRPFVVIDPRAGHGPGIGGFKADSEIGVAFESRPSLLFRRLPARSHAGPDHRGYRPCRSVVPRKGHRAAPCCRRQAMRDRQLPGRMGGDDAGRRSVPSCSVRSSSPDRRCPTGRACTARIRCATAADCSAAAG